MKINFRRLLTGAGAAAVTILALLPGAAPASAADCLSATQLNSFTATGSPFGGGTTLSWHVTPGCSGVAVIMDTHIGASGTVVKNPAATTEYRLYAVTGGILVRQLGVRVVLAGKAIGYQMTGRAGLQSFPAFGPAGEAAKAIAHKITRAFTDSAKRRFLGKVLEVHVIPTNIQLTRLPPWVDKAGETTCGGQTDCVADRPWSQVRGIGGTEISGTNRIATAVGAEELVPVTGNPWPNTHRSGHVLAHELGHVPLQFAPANIRNAVQDVLQARREAGGEFIGNEDYTQSTADEYWAEGTAALFRYPIADGAEHLTEFDGYWLKQNDPALLQLLRGVYQGVLICSPAGSCSL